MQNSESNPSYISNRQTNEAESAVVGSLLVDTDLLDVCPLDVESFSTYSNKAIYGAMRKIAERGEPVDMVTIAMELGDAIDGIGIDYISELANSIPSTANFSFYVDKVREFHLERKGKEIVAKYQNDEITMIEMIASLSDIDSQRVRKGANTMGDLLNELYADMQKDKQEISGVPMGVPELDRILDGMQGGDLITVGARPGAGKTAFSMNVAGNVADAGYSVSLFNYEMKSLALARRLVSPATLIESHKMKNGDRMNELDWTKFSQAAGALAERPMMVHEAPGMHARDIRRAVAQDMKKFKREKHVVIIDYLQLVSSINPRDNANNMAAKVGEICRELKLMALQFDVPVILLSQLSRAVEQRQDKRPMMSDLRESGNIEQDSDVILMLYRDDYYNKESEDAGTIEVIVTKQRDGDTGTVKMWFRKEYGKLLSMETGQ